MGLDSIEIMVKVEKTFDISIPDREAEQIVTMGDFHNCVWKNLEGKYGDRCQSQVLFYKLRQVLFNNFQIPKSDFKLDESMEDIFPMENRRESYANFSIATDLELPALKLTRPWKLFLNTVGFVLIAGGLVVSSIEINFFKANKSALIFPFVGYTITILISEMLNNKRIVIKPNTVRGFVQEVMVRNYSKLIKNGGINRKEVETVINLIVADMAGLEIEEITPEKRIGADLGID